MEYLLGKYYEKYGIRIVSEGGDLKPNCDCEDGETSHTFGCGLVQYKDKIYLNGSEVRLCVTDYSGKIEYNDYYIDDIGALRQSFTSDKQYWAARPDYSKVVAISKSSKDGENSLSKFPKFSKKFVDNFVKEFKSLDFINNVYIEIDRTFDCSTGKKYPGACGIEQECTCEYINKIKVDTNNEINVLSVEESKLQDLVKLLESSGIRKHTRVNDTGYSQLEIDIVKLLSK